MVVCFEIYPFRFTDAAYNQGEMVVGRDLQLGIETKNQRNV